jgi:hypothetical protein
MRSRRSRWSKRMVTNFSRGKGQFDKTSVDCKCFVRPLFAQELELFLSFGNELPSTSTPSSTRRWPLAASSKPKGLVSHEKFPRSDAEQACPRKNGPARASASELRRASMSWKEWAAASELSGARRARRRHFRGPMQSKHVLERVGRRRERAERSEASERCRASMS